MKTDDLGETLLYLINEYLRTLKLHRQIIPEVHLEFPSRKEYGDLSVNLAFKLSKILKKPPRIIADSLVSFLNENIKDTTIQKYISSIQIAGGGFINFFLTENYFRKILQDILILDDNFGRSNVGKKRKVLVEFISANPTGPLSVAHARQAAVGDALCNILSFLNFRLKREYYINDEGNQIDLLGKSIEARLKQLQGESAKLPDGGYEGEYIWQIAREILKKKSATVKRRGATRGGETSPSTKLRAGTEQGQSARNQRPEYFSDYGVKYILRIIKQELNDFGIEFDSWHSQKKLTKSNRITKALHGLKRKGFIYEKDKAFWFKSTAFGDDKDRVVIKSDGSYTYLTSDIAYHNNKYQRGFMWLINLWGPDHHGYIARLKAAVQALGKDLNSLSIVIVQLATIFRDGKPLPMSTRRGQYITLREVLDEVGSDASRFLFLMRRTSAHLDFDLELAKKHTPENPVYYVQYAHARICSIIRNVDFKPKVFSSDLNLLKQAEEIRLMKLLWQFPRTLEICYRNIDPYFVTAYLQEVAEELHRLYDRHRVLSENRKLTEARLALISAARIVLRQGLSLLGVSSPESM
jgi:arginyl-tRNA synthetase